MEGLRSNQPQTLPLLMLVLPQREIPPRRVTAPPLLPVLMVPLLRGRLRPPIAPNSG